VSARRRPSRPEARSWWRRTPFADRSRASRHRHDRAPRAPVQAGSASPSGLAQAPRERGCAYGPGAARPRARNRPARAPRPRLRRRAGRARSARALRPPTSSERAPRARPPDRDWPPPDERARAAHPVRRERATTARWRSVQSPPRRSAAPAARARAPECAARRRSARALRRCRLSRPACSHDHLRAPALQLRADDDQQHDQATDRDRQPRRLAPARTRAAQARSAGFEDFVCLLAAG